MRIFEKIQKNINVDDDEFDLIYPETHVEISEFHYTPIEVAKVAANFLVIQKGDKVLDIGSGAGKFCTVGALTTKGLFTGVELRASLHELAIKITQKYELRNTVFIHNNITEIDFEEFDAFYFYNPFYENISASGWINDEIDLDKYLYTRYNLYVINQLKKTPKGTRLVTYFGYLKEISDHFVLINTAFDDKLKMWEKK